MPILETIRGVCGHLGQWTEKSNLVFPILLSLVSATIFWIVFSYIPERTRRRKLRPIVELALFDAYKKLFFLFDLILRHNDKSPSFYQSDIRSGKLSEIAIARGLANKCLNASYLYDADVRDRFLVIGQRIFDQSLEIDQLADKILGFHTFATAQEILLLEKIREKLRVYDFGQSNIDRNAVSVIGKSSFYPADPSISYRCHNFNELYLLFCRLQNVVLGRHPTDRDRFICKMQMLLHSGRFRECRKLLRTQGRKFAGDSILCKGYLALAEHGLGNMKEFYKVIDDTYKLRPYNGTLVSSRGIFRGLLNDRKLLEILARHHSVDEIAALTSCVLKEQEREDAFVRSNENLQCYVEKKRKAMSAN